MTDHKHGFQKWIDVVGAPNGKHGNALYRWNEALAASLEAGTISRTDYDRLYMKDTMRLRHWKQKGIPISAQHFAVRLFISRLDYAPFGGRSVADLVFSVLPQGIR
tara:strand:+ start:93 stop:410 length:318 start_codon:yes stop_codon:yes gene_type:complete